MFGDTSSPLSATEPRLTEGEGTESSDPGSYNPIPPFSLHLIWFLFRYFFFVRLFVFKPAAAAAASASSFGRVAAPTHS